MRKKYYSKIIAVIGVVLAVAALFFAWKKILSVSAGSVAVPVAEKKANPIYFSELDGSAVASATAQWPQVVAIMIDNHPDAKPQAGLDKAPIVYEAPVEGGLTRYMAIFSADSDVAKAGPVRSARHNFLDWLAEYGPGALYMHVGGSPMGLDQIVSRGIFDANQFFNGATYWRDQSRLAPHNVYTSSSLWQAFISVHNQPTSTWDGWKFNTSGAASSTPTSSPDANFKFSYGNSVQWKYNLATGKYERWANGLRDKDSDGKTLSAKNVLAQYTRVTVIDSEGRREIRTVGTGRAEAYINGQVITGTWKKENPASRTRFYDANGQEITLFPGNTWVEVVPL